MAIFVAGRRQKLARLQTQWPDAAILDVTSKGTEPWVRFSPFYPHGGIPIPNSSDTAQSVEGLWQGLKVFEKEDVDPRKWAVINMQGIKRGGKSRGSVRGHRFGPTSETLLGYRDARRRIYLPAYRWALENRLTEQFARSRAINPWAANWPLPG